MTNNVIVDVLCSRVLDRLHSNSEVSACENKRRSTDLQFQWICTAKSTPSINSISNFVFVLFQVSVHVSESEDEDDYEADEDDEGKLIII